MEFLLPSGSAHATLGSALAIGGAEDGPGAIFVYQKDGVDGTQIGKLSATGAVTTFFGDTIAVTGDTVVAGLVSDTTLGSVAGTAFVFTTRTDLGLSKTASLKASRWRTCT